MFLSLEREVVVVSLVLKNVIIIFSKSQPYDATSQQKSLDLNLKKQVQQVRFNKSIPPLSAQEPTPMEVFLYHSQAATFARGPGKLNEST
jgi:hypothetical protein